MRLRRYVRALAALVLAPALALPRVATAAPTADSRARADFREGLRLRKEGKLDQACDRFEQSYAEGAEPGALYNLARCRQQQGRFAEAHQELLTLAQRAEEAKQGDTAQTMRAEAETLLPKLARLDLVRRGDARSEVTSVTVDGAVVLQETWTQPIYVMPGVHVVAALHGDGVSVRRTSNDLPAAASQRLELDDAPPPPPPPPPVAAVPSITPAAPEREIDHRRRVAAYVTGGAALGLLAAGSITGALSFSKKSSASNTCGGSISACTGSTDEANDDLSSARHLATASTIGFIAGGVAAGAAVFLFATSSHERASTPGAQLAPFADGHAGGLELTGRF